MKQKMLKRILKKTSVVLMATVMTGSLLIPFSVIGSEQTEIKSEQGFNYKVEKESNGSKNVVIYGYNGNDDNITIPETLGGYKVTSVESLDGSKNYIKSLLISKNVKNIFERIELSDSNGKARKIEIEKYEVVDENPYLSAKDGVLFNKKQTVLMNYPRGKKDVEYVEPSTVEKSNGANQNKYVTKWTHSSNKKNVNVVDYALRNCQGLKEVFMPENIRRIGTNSYMNCSKLERVHFSKNLERISDDAFYNCKAITKIEIPKSVLSIGDGAFENCNISSLKLKNRISYIGGRVFYGNAKLKKVKIPDSVTKISKKAFDKRKTKVVMASYMKKQNGKFNNYIAKATITTKGKKKQYQAIWITKIKGLKKTKTIGKGKAGKISTKAYVCNKDTKLNKSGVLKTDILNFTSSNNKVVKVSSNGTIKGIRKGTATITVTLRTTPESYKSNVIKDTDGTVITAKTGITKKYYKIKIKVK